MFKAHSIASKRRHSFKFCFEVRLKFTIMAHLFLQNGEELEQVCPLVEYVVVPELPRSALVEWQVYATTGPVHCQQG